MIKKRSLLVLLLLFLIAALVGGFVAYREGWLERKDYRDDIEREGPKLTWNGDEGEKLTGFEGEVVKFETDGLKLITVKRGGGTEAIKVRDDAVIGLSLGDEELKEVSEEEIKIGDKVAVMAVEKEDDLWTTGYVKILRKQGIL